MKKINIHKIIKIISILYNIGEKNLQKVLFFLEFYMDGKYPYPLLIPCRFNSFICGTIRGIRT